MQSTTGNRERKVRSMKKILVYLKDYKKESILAPLFKMLEASFELLVPLVVKKIVDIGIADSDRGYVGKMCLLMIALGLIGLVCSITAQYFSAKAAVGFATKLRHVLFGHMQKLSYAQTDHMGTSTMITRMTSDINQVQNGVNLVLRLFLRSPFIVFGAMIMAFTIDVKAALIFVVVIPLLSIVVFGIMLITIPLYKKVQGGLDRLLGVTRGNLTGVRVLRAFHKEEEERKTFDEANEKLTGFQMFVGRISAVMNPATYIIINGGLVVLLWVGAVKVDNGILTQGAVLALVNLIPRFYEATKGSVKIDGVAAEDYDYKALRAKIGMVPQKAVLFKGTIRENLLMGLPEEYKKKLEENPDSRDETIEKMLRDALEISQSAEFVDNKPEGMETMVSQGGKNLSGGQKQRLTIARALVRKPEILILDDSASALDYATDLKLRKAIHGMEKTPVVFIVSQRASSLLAADSIIVLDDGNVAGIGTHDELLASCSVYQEIYYSQYPDKRKEA